MSNSSKFWGVIGLIAMLYGNYLIYNFISSTDKDRVDKQYCGKVVKKSDEEVTIKHGSRTDLYLIVEFDQIGLRSIEVEPNTYFTHNKGDRVCFGLNNYDLNGRKQMTFKESALDLLKFLFMFLIGIANIVLIFISIGLSIEALNKKLDGK